MKKLFSKEELFNASGCYINRPNSTMRLIDQLPSTNQQIDVIDILKSDLFPIKDLRWFLFNSCDLTIKEKQELALSSAKAVAHIYNKKHPNDNRVSMCINITARYLKGLVSLEILLKYKTETYDAAAYAAADAAYAADAAADADAAEKLINNWINSIKSFN